MSLEVAITKRFRGFTLDVAFEAGDETLGFLGASGCGKSLTLRCIAGIERPDEGRIVVGGRVFFDSDQGIDLSPQERKTALLFQSYMLFPNMTVEQNVAAGIGREVPKDERAAIVAGELKRFGLEGFEARYPAQLSGGQQQRVALARMLAARPGILMLDEPFSALDAHLKGVLEQNLVSLFDDYQGTILYVSHDIDEALLLAQASLIGSLGRTSSLSVAVDAPKPPESAVHVGAGLEVYVALGGHVDFAAERARMEKEAAKLAADVAKLDKKLSNEGFLAKAAPEVVEKDRGKRAELADKLERLNAQMAELG